MTDRIAVYPGSFDPATLGHLDILDRALTMFDRVVVAVLTNSSKQALFSASERCEILRAAIGDRQNVEVKQFSGLTVEVARQAGAVALVRGLRAVSDFEAEFQMALMNRKLAPEIHTVFLMTLFSNVYVSSSLIKEIARFGGKFEDLVPEPAAKALHSKFKEKS
jgi:pantetheine-phosphate adenylyltransferase